MNTEPQVDQDAIADNVQRTVERTALRNVRKLADELEAEQAAKRKLERRALIIVAVVGTVFAVWFTLGLIASDEKFDRGRTIQVPDKIVVPKKD
jgi:hypothetical protein